MKKVFDIVRGNPLFAGIAFDDFEKMFGCLWTKTQEYKKDDIILCSGDRVNFVGILLCGSAQIINEDSDGNRAILTELSPSELFGEVFACAGIVHSPVTVLSTDNSQVLFLDYNRMITSCTSACPFHTKLIENMLMMIARKNLLLHQKIEILSGRTTREKLLLFFDRQRGMAKKFTIPYNREELANYLCVDRSAMSNELGRMRDEGLILFHKNEFELL